MEGEPEKDDDMRGKPRVHPLDLQIGAQADRQHGVVARRQLIALGAGERGIDHRVAAGRLYTVQRGVYAVGHRTLSQRGYWMAGVLTCGPTAVLSHHTALALYEIRGSRSKIDVTVPGRCRSDRGSLRIHASVLDPDDITLVDGIPVTSVARALLDAGAELDSDQLARAVEESERRQLFDLRAVERVLARRPHTRGSLRLRRLLADYRDPALTRSELERLFVELLKRAGIPLPLINTIVAGLEVDFYWPDARLVIELDGRAYHSSARAFEQDRLRDARLLREGIRVLRITYRRLHDDPAGVIADVLALISRVA